MSGSAFRPGAIRRAACSGTWYAADPGELRAHVQSLLGLHVEPPPPATGRLHALVVPHAGLRYSGATAALAFRLLGCSGFSRVVVLAPNHRVALRGAAVDPSSSYETPLGQMQVDAAAVAAFARQPLVQMTAKPFVDEHSIEMQLPFLQHCLPEATLVPILIGDLRSDQFAVVATALRTLVTKETLLIISSDFMHFGAAFGYVPFSDDVEKRIAATDRQAIDAILQRSFTAFQQTLRATGNTICGRQPLSVFLHFLTQDPGSTWNGELLGYTTSGKSSGDYRHSVSYASLAFRAAADVRA